MTRHSFKHKNYKYFPPLNQIHILLVFHLCLFSLFYGACLPLFFRFQIAHEILVFYLMNDRFCHFYLICEFFLTLQFVQLYHFYGHLCYILKYFRAKQVRQLRLVPNQFRFNLMLTHLQVNDDFEILKLLLRLIDFIIISINQFNHVELNQMQFNRCLFFFQLDYKIHWDFFLLIHLFLIFLILF